MNRKGTARKKEEADPAGSASDPEERAATGGNQQHARRGSVDQTPRMDVSQRQFVFTVSMTSGKGKHHFRFVNPDFL
jgi:hypothetical protein